MAKKKSKGKTILRIISIIIWLIAIIILGMLTYEIYCFDILPSKYYLIIGAVALFLIILFILFIANKKTKKVLLVLLDILFIIMIGVCFFAYDKLKSVVDFMDANLGAKYDTNVYYVIVNSKSEYKNIESIKGKTVKLVDDINDKETLERSFNKKLDVTYEYVDNISELLYEIKENPELILIVNSGNYDAMIENDGMIETDIKFESSIKKLETLEIVFKVENEETGVDVTIDPFVVYISGIDTRSNKLPAKSGSDVNIILVINPKKHEILMINTPRDYFVQLNGTTGLKDKLTHAGLVGGYQLSIATLEDLYGIDIHYYARVNFNAVIKLVDAIGGITVNSDVDYKITCHTDNKCIIKPGDNKVDGRCALAFARERYAYKTGDRHRGENQEQVITKIIEKVTSSTTLLTKSDQLLESMSGTFQTNITTEEIASLVKLQLDEMPHWKISTYNVTGSDSYQYSYSYPKTELYVMVPDEKTVNTAKEKIKEALKTK